MKKLELKNYLDAFKYKTPCRLSRVGLFNLDLEYPNNSYSEIGYISDISTYSDGGEISGSLKLKNGLHVDFDFKISEDSDIELIYHPLSNLTKEIEHNGDKFVPAYKLIDLAIERGDYTQKYAKGHEHFCYKIIKKPFGKVLKCTEGDEWILYISFSDIGRNKYWVIEELLKLHFDIHGLIENGLAIDINTL